MIGDLVRRWLPPRGVSRVAPDVTALEARHRQLAHATEQWLSLLNELERECRTGELQYEQYYQAYLRAKREQKKVELDLFNRRKQLVV